MNQAGANMWQVIVNWIGRLFSGAARAAVEAATPEQARERYDDAHRRGTAYLMAQRYD